MGHTACTEPQCLYKGALYMAYIFTSLRFDSTVATREHSFDLCGFYYTWLRMVKYVGGKKYEC